MLTSTLSKQAPFVDIQDALTHRRGAAVSVTHATFKSIPSKADEMPPALITAA
jgi:hypothetical protein